VIRSPLGILFRTSLLIASLSLPAIAQVNYLPKALELKCSFPSLKRTFYLLLDSPKGGDANIVNLDTGLILFRDLIINERYYLGLGYAGNKNHIELLIGKKLGSPTITITIDRQTGGSQLMYFPLETYDLKQLKPAQAVGKCELHKSRRKF